MDPGLITFVKHQRLVVDLIDQIGLVLETDVFQGTLLDNPVYDFRQPSFIHLWPILCGQSS